MKWELARANQQMIQRLGKIFEKTKSKTADPANLIHEAQHANT